MNNHYLLPVLFLMLLAIIHQYNNNIVNNAITSSDIMMGGFAGAGFANTGTSTGCIPSDYLSGTRETRLGLFDIQTPITTNVIQQINIATNTINLIRQEYNFITSPNVSEPRQGNVSIARLRELLNAVLSVGSDVYDINVACAGDPVTGSIIEDALSLSEILRQDIVRSIRQLQQGTGIPA
jgi:hypothetical protein